jgi:hypothetical protein
VRLRGSAWIALPGLVSLCYLTHLDGPQQADLLLLGGTLSFRALEYGALMLLLALDLLWRPHVDFDPEDEGLLYRAVIGSEESLSFDLDEEGGAATVGAGEPLEVNG